MTCGILDWRCIFVNELIGSGVLAVLFILLIYVIIASKLKIGFETSLAILVPVMLLTSLAIGGFNSIYAFSIFIVAVVLAWVVNRFLGN